jgi:hypothetical protein
VLCFNWMEFIAQGRGGEKDSECASEVGGRNDRVGASGNELLKAYLTPHKSQGAKRRASMFSQPLRRRELRFPYLLLIFKPLEVGGAGLRTTSLPPPTEAAGGPPLVYLNV